MVLDSELDNYLHFCKIGKELDEKTTKAYKVDINQFIKVVGNVVENVSRQDINEYILYLHSTYRQKTVKRKIASIKAYFNYLDSEELICVNPMRNIKTKFKEETILPKIIPRDVIEQILEYLYRLLKSDEYTIWQKKIVLRDLAIIETLFATGVRISELCNIQKNAIDLKTGVIRIKGKGGKERYLQITNEDVIELLNKYYNTFSKEIDKSGYFFVNRYGSNMSEQSARCMIHKYTKELEINTNITPHMFRHSFATYLLEENVNIRYIQKMLGHSSITTTQIYTYVATEKERKILQTSHPRNKMNLNK